VVVAEHAFTSRSTLQKIEAGNTNVSVGIYAAILQARTSGPTDHG
jgi:hypothetical protein